MLESKNLLREFCSQVFFIYFSELCCLFKQKIIWWTGKYFGLYNLETIHSLSQACEPLWKLSNHNVKCTVKYIHTEPRFCICQPLITAEFIKVAFSFPYSSFFEHLCHTPFVSKVQSVILAISQWLRNWFNSAIVVSNKVTATDRSASLFSIITRKMNVNFSIAGAQFYILGPVIISK